MGSFYFNYKDLFKAPRAAIGPQRIGIAALGILVSHLAYLFFTYLAIILSGVPLSTVWSTQGIIVWAFSFPLTFPAKLAALAGIFLALFLLLLTNTAVSRAAYMLLRDNLFYTWQQSFRFAFRKAGAIVGNYIVFIFMISPFIIGALILAAIGRIPWFGEILNALATLFYIFAGMALVFFTLSFFISFAYGPVIISCSEEDSFGSSVQALHLTWGQPWRLVIYSALAVALGLLGIFFFAFVLKVGLIIYSILFMPLMHSLSPLLNNALYYVQSSLGGLDSLMRGLLGHTGEQIFYLKQSYLPLHLTLSTQISSWIVYFSLMLAGYLAIGYGLAVGNASLVISYIIYSKRLTDSNLLERADSEIDEGEPDIKIDPKQGDTKNLG